MNMHAKIEGREALVMFCDRTELPWLRLLRPGFRHCFLALRDAGRWIIYEPYSNRTVVSIADPAPAFDLPGFFAGLGCTVVPTTLGPTPSRAVPWAPYTCVEGVKRILGIRSRWIVTPWQLFRHLTKNMTINL